MRDLALVEACTPRCSGVPVPFRSTERRSALNRKEDAASVDAAISGVPKP